MLKEKVLEELRSADGFLSGQRLADQLNVSRNAVWKAVKTLQEEGYEIVSVRNLGYRLDQATRRLSHQEIVRRLPFEPRLLIFEELGSTNTYVKDHHKDLPDGTAVLARRQTMGRGRLGRSFYSPPEDGLYLSLLYKGETMPRPELVTVAAAVAAADVLISYGLSPSIKWVNDLMLGDKKAAGILTEGELELESGRMKYLVLGVGLNVNTDVFPEQLKSQAISLKQAAGRTFDINEVAAKLLCALDAQMKRLSQDDLTYRETAREIIGSYNQRLYLKGQTVTLSGGNRPDLTGVLLGTDEAGRLLIRSKEETISASYGEYRLNPQKG